MIGTITLILMIRKLHFKEVKKLVHYYREQISGKIKSHAFIPLSVIPVQVSR